MRVRLAEEAECDIAEAEAGGGDLKVRLRANTGERGGERAGRMPKWRC